MRKISIRTHPEKHSNILKIKKKKKDWWKRTRHGSKPARNLPDEEPGTEMVRSRHVEFVGEYIYGEREICQRDRTKPGKGAAEDDEDFEIEDRERNNSIAKDG